MSVTTGAGWRLEPAVGIWIVAGGCWSLLIMLALTGVNHPGHEVVAVHATATGLDGARPFLSGWLVMVGAMMLPIVALDVRRLAARAPAGGPVGVVLAVFVGVWAAFGMAALAGDTQVHHVVEQREWLGQRPALVLAGAFALAGAVQLGSLWSPTLAAVRHRRVFPSSPADFGGPDAWRAGLRYGAASLVCDGPLMFVMFAVGLDHLGMMAAVTAVMLAERHERWRSGVATITGWALVVAAGVVAMPTLIGGAAG